ncbi:ATP-binding cassette domain-containing protein [Tessaracoccus rhinocerotis]|uniref:ATP-binding cassette domain-containing protein n=1 Tax=Tessaracoccus rhinocerotis TaxID=1689449 RepID=A0A553JWN2_9ACTN|nr:ATP-binding cassette domain-containing protein [Tessaracoccus rhinocerotis]TRY16887.1 ATP-binding cassette domain-containing protein [Tessaracoccus rhinocerotis]
MTGIRVDAAVRVRDVVLDLDLPEGSCTAAIGPNGAGKSTFVGLLSGALRPDTGTVAIHGRTVAGPGGFVPPHKRGVALLEQRSLLFPHLDVLANAMFGLRSRGVPRHTARAEALAQLERVGCADLTHRRPNQLSGGQAQRVALARALAIKPDVVLLDEPMAAMDVAAAPEIRSLLRTHLAGRTSVLVTHDLLDVLTLASHVVVLERGRVVEQGRVADVLPRPRSQFLADFTGVNLLFGDLVDGGLRLADGTVVAGLAGDDATAGPGWASIPANAVGLHLADPHGSPRNAVDVVVRAVEPRGPVVRVVVDLAGQALAADLTTGAVAELGVEPGLRLVASIKATAVTLY